MVESKGMADGRSCSATVRYPRKYVPFSKTLRRQYPRSLTFIRPLRQHETKSFAPERVIEYCPAGQEWRTLNEVISDNRFSYFSDFAGASRRRHPIVRCQRSAWPGVAGPRSNTVGGSHIHGDGRDRSGGLAYRHFGRLGHLRPRREPANHSGHLHPDRIRRHADHDRAAIRPGYAVLGPSRDRVRIHAGDRRVFRLPSGTLNGTEIQKFWAEVNQPDGSLSFSLVPDMEGTLSGTVGITGSVSIGGTPSSSAPEPGTAGLLAAGLVLAIAMKMRVPSK